LNLDNAESDSVLIHSYLEEANQAKSEGEIRKLRNILGKAEHVADSLAVPLLLQAVERELGDYYLETSSYDSAQMVLERAVERTSDKKKQSQLLNLLATAYRYQSKYPEAMNTYNQGLSLIDSLESPDTYMAINTNKASIYEDTGNYSEAISLYQKGITFAETAGNSSFLATALNNLGNLYYEQGNNEEAKTYLVESIAISEEQGFYNTLLRAKHNLASSERDLGNYDEARNLYREAWSLHEKVRPDNPPIQLLYNIGLLHLEISELDKAEEHFRESLEYSQKRGVPAGIFYNFVGLGDVALARGNLSASTDFYHDGFDIAKKLDSPPFRITVSEKLYEAYKEEGNFEQALKYFESAKEVSDSLVQAQQDEQLALAETELGLRQQQKINGLLQERQEQQKARIEAQNWLIIAFTIVFIVILVSLYLLYQSNKERRRINKELERQQRKLEEMNSVKDKMLAIIAHDLRSPMASMKGMLYMLEEEDFTKQEIGEMAAQLNISITRNISMMDNLLVWAQEQMSGLELDIKPVDAHDVTEKVFSNFELQVKKKGITLINKVPKELKVLADVNLITLILRNLVSNSIKFSHEGDEVVVSTSRSASGEVVFEVIDTGIGIPEEKRDSLFSMKVESRSGTKNEKGSGLGLQLCKEFVEKQGGEINVESTEGKGTIFQFSLPKAS
jgi:signal transduction histidine kinase